MAPIVELDVDLLDAHHPNPPRHDVIGYVCLVGVLITWVGQSEVAQLVQLSGYNKPMALTWFNHTAGVLLLPLMLLLGQDLRAALIELQTAMSRRQIFLRTLLISLLYLIADWAWYIALPYTSVAIGTAIINTMAVWVYLISVLCLGAKQRWRQSLALLACMLGVVLCMLLPGSSGQAEDWQNQTARQESRTQDHQVWANVCVLFGALGYAIYELAFDAALHDTHQGASMTTVFVGLCSIANGLFLWPIFLLLGAPGLPAVVGESFVLPIPSALPGICINAALATLFNVCFALAIVRTSPLLVATACVLTIPLSLLVDFLWHGMHFNIAQILGSLVIGVGFMLLAYDKSLDPE